ncbi:MAG TPA: NADP-dependent malic enzyme [Flavobacteriaceae bacterium]|nr:NADP-dependent malic enzyme [Flavobacteriaceae bacterium]
MSRMKESMRREALLYHAKPKPGKIEVVPTKKYATQRDLSLAYSPGVAEPCLEIAKNKENVYKYTSKGNLVAVITNGTAVLGLGDIGPEASKPVMEGKGLLFKIFADIDVFDIELDVTDPEEFIRTVKNMAPTFGGINLEDIKAPEAFEIERRLKEELDIPVMHDDQHGTAIISAAALLNAVELAGKKMSEVQVVISGAGAAAVSCARLYIASGVRPENIVMLDSKGVIRSDRENLSVEKKEFASGKDVHELTDAIVGADVFVGLSIGNIFTPQMLLDMADNPIVFAMANPDPEIEYELAVGTREDVIMATGRSDHPNQVNNVLGFPYIFRGALDVRAKAINEEMKMAAVLALAALAKEPVPEQVNIAYGETKLVFGREYIIPKPFDPRLITHVPVAVARAAIESGVARITITDWAKYEDELSARMGEDSKLIKLLLNRARTNAKRVVFAEADQLDVLKAAQISHENGIAIPVLLGREDVIRNHMQEIEFDADVEIIDPTDDKSKELRDKYAHEHWLARNRKGVSKYDANRLMRDRNYFGAMMVQMGDADGMISGYTRAYASVLRPALQVVGKHHGTNKVATANLMMTKKGPLFIADTAVNINPTAQDLVDIAQMTNYTMKMFGLDPVIAMVSYSNFGSAKSPGVEKVQEAVKLLHENYPDIKVDGEVQADFALNKELIQKNFPHSKLAGKSVNALIFPNLEAANSNYKMLKEINNVESIGPIMLGMHKPIHLLQLGASVEEMVSMVAVVVVDAQEKEMRRKQNKE